MSEKINSTRENQFPQSLDAEKNLDRIRRSLEKEVESGKEKTERNKSEILKTIHENSKSLNELSPRKKETAVTEIGPQELKRQKDEHYSQSLNDVRRKLTSNERVLSAIIHNRTVDKASEITAKTIGRPIPLLSAFAVTGLGSLVIYIVAKQNGYLIDTHFITFILFAAGIILGLILDLLYITYKVMRARSR